MYFLVLLDVHVQIHAMKHISMSVKITLSLSTLT